VNIVAIIGNVASEPELRHTEQGRAICSFRVAVSRPGDGTTADFFEIVAWERQAEICKQYLDIGRRVAVEGRMHCRVVEADDQARRTNIELVACRVELLSPNSRADRAQSVEQVEVAR
jgi:single-strand DNA-binding protein